MTKREFKPFQKVLIRDNDSQRWRAGFYSHFDGISPCPHRCVGTSAAQCIPYEGNERLLGTTDGPEPKFRKGDIVAVWDKGDFHKKIRIYSRYDGRFHRHVVLDCLFSNGSADEYMFDFAEKFAAASVQGKASS